MAIFMIGDDLNDADKSYDGLIRKIEEISDGYCHQLDSTWLIGHPGTAGASCDARLPFLDHDDDPLVVLLTSEGDWASLEIMDDRVALTLGFPCPLTAAPPSPAR